MLALLTVGLLGVTVATGFFLALTIDDAIDPALQRPDYGAAAKALGTPLRDQIVVTPNLGGAPMALYRPGAESIPPGGWAARQVVLALPLPRADVTSVRPATPAPPPGFTFEGRKDARTFTLICYGSSVPHSVPAPTLLALAGTAGAPAQVWPGASKTIGAVTPTGAVCGQGR